MVFVGISRCVFFIVVVICGLFSLLSSLYGFFLLVCICVSSLVFWLLVFLVVWIFLLL